ncbi:hypothetical protein SDC9_123088 [bioreactor metagenome]|uniref:MarR family transcriptional regulator n=1 Tax=bioreactor metagenome TaxID=1076179 RepID=A0A645CGR1_9ZZZZ
MRIKASEQWEQWDKDNEQIATQFIESMFSGVSMDEVADLSSSLMRIFDNLDNINGGT